MSSPLVPEYVFRLSDSCSDTRTHAFLFSFFFNFRIEGGIGTILKWWPIKAYRPCPNFIDKGGFYQRSGQGLDEIAFGRDSTYDGQ